MNFGNPNNEVYLLLHKPEMGLVYNKTKYDSIEQCSTALNADEDNRQKSLLFHSFPLENKDLF